MGEGSRPTRQVCR